MQFGPLVVRLGPDGNGIVRPSCHCSEAVRRQVRESRELLWGLREHEGWGAYRWALAAVALLIGVWMPPLGRRRRCDLHRGRWLAARDHRGHDGHARGRRRRHLPVRPASVARDARAASRCVLAGERRARPRDDADRRRLPRSGDALAPPRRPQCPRPDGAPHPRRDSHRYGALTSAPPSASRPTRRASRTRPSAFFSRPGSRPRSTGRRVAGRSEHRRHLRRAAALRPASSNFLRDARGPAPTGTSARLTLRSPSEAPSALWSCRAVAGSKLELAIGGHLPIYCPIAELDRRYVAEAVAPASCGLR